jgi:hypothetical protein
MLHRGFYKQAINRQLSFELVKVSKARKAVTSIAEAKTPRVLAQYFSDAVQKGMDNVLDSVGELSAQSALTNQSVALI